MPQQIIFFLQRQERPGADWVRQDEPQAPDARILEPMVARLNTRAKEQNLTYRYKIERVVLDIVDWETREQARLTDGTYKPLPKKGDWHLVHKYHPKFYAHLADQPGYIAFTLSALHGVQDKQNSMLASRFLQKHCREFIHEEMFEDMAAEVGEKPRELKVLFTDNGTEIAKVYMKGHGGPTNSCMSYGLGHWPGHKHPCQFYGKPGNLALVYTMTRDSLDDQDCTITARTIVNTDNKVWGRTYGFQRDIARLEKWLQKEGYTRAGEGRADAPELWAGSKFKTEKGVGTTACYYTPYIDFAQIMHLNPKNLMFKLWPENDEIPDHHVPYLVQTNATFAQAVELCECCKRRRTTARSVTFTDGDITRSVQKKLCNVCVKDHKRCVACALYVNSEKDAEQDNKGRTFCLLCANALLCPCHECNVRIFRDDAKRMYKYKKNGKLTKPTMVRTCLPCYRELITKYRAWGLPNF